MIIFITGSSTRTDNVTATKRVHILTHHPLTKWLSFCRRHLKCILVNEKFSILIKISLKGPIDNKAALVQIMAWRRTGDKPLPEPTLTQFNDAYMRHYGEMS